MNAIKARFDGKKVVFPAKFKRPRPGNIIIVFESETNDDAAVSSDLLLKAQDEVLAGVWHNKEDEIYDAL